jgi:putative tryptophan/tyrosine transport system substrate-binding protein
MDRLSRRQFVLGAAGLGLVTGCGLLPERQPPPTAVKVYRLGFLRGSDPTAQAGNVDRFRQALGELGYVEGQNLAIEYRWGDGSDARLAEPAAELARLPVDVFVVPSVTVARIVREATTTIPIVLAGTGDDPVEAGLAASYARPGGNVTGVTNLGTALNGKRLQLLKEAVPSISRVAILWDTPTYGPFPTEDWSRHAQTVGLQFHPMALHSPAEFDAAFEAALAAGADSLFVSGGPIGNAHRAQIIQFAARLRWPAMYSQRQFVDEGGLLVYAASLADLWRRAAVYVDKILRGTNPADLPIEQPMTFDLVVNMKTAQTLGITFPFSNEIMLQVTEVIQE